MSDQFSNVAKLRTEWQQNPRWSEITRPYSAEEVIKLRGNLPIQNSYAHHTAQKLWEQLQQTKYINALGALTGNQALQMARAGLKAIYVSGWQIAADGNTAGQMYPDLCLYPSNSVPAVVQKLSNTLRRADQIQCFEGKSEHDFLLPLVADGDAGFGSVLSTYELMSSLIEAGAAGVHFEDQHSSAKKCGHLGGKVMVPTREVIDKLVAARLAADVHGVPTVIIARTDAMGAFLMTSDIDPQDAPFIDRSKERTPEGLYHYKGGMEAAVARGLAVAPYADLIWCETSTPNLEEARKYAEAIHAKFPNKMLAYNCSPSFNWKKNLSDAQIAVFQRKLGAMGYKFQFITLAGFHSLNYGMFTLAKDYAFRGMSAFVELQEQEFKAAELGFTAVKHQREVGTNYFDGILDLVSRGRSATTALHGSTETEQFFDQASAEERPSLAVALGLVIKK